MVIQLLVFYESQQQKKGRLPLLASGFSDFGAFVMIKKIKNGKWRVDVTLGTKLDGSRDRRVKHFDTKTEAEKYERSLLVQKRHPLSSVLEQCRFNW